MTTHADHEFKKSGLHLDANGATVWTPPTDERLINESDEALRIHTEDGHRADFAICSVCRDDWGHEFFSQANELNAERLGDRLN